MDTELDILIRAITDVKSADDATKQLVDRVFSKLKDGAIELPINSKLDKSELKKLDDNVKQARKEVVSRYNKLQKEMADPKGFDAFSDKAINELVELGKAYAKFNSKASGQSKNSTTAVSDVKAALGEVFQLYENEIKLLNSKIKELNLQDKVSKTLITTRRVRGPRNFGTHSKEEIDANIEQNNKRKYKGLSSIAPKEASTTIDAGRTNKHLMKLSEYSSYGSNWATELSRILKIEIEKAAETLTSWIEPNYKVGGKDNKIGLGNTTSKTTEKQFLGDTIKAVKNQLTKAIRDLESGSEEITLDTLKEYAAVIKVLTKAIGKTTEDAEKTITGSIEKVYNSNTEVKTRRGTKSTLTKIGGVDRDEGKEKGVGVAHDNTQKLVKALYESMHQWDSEVIADTISKEMISGTDKTIKAVNKNNKKQSSNTSADKQVGEVKLSSDYKTAMAQLTTTTDGVFAEVRNGTKATQAQMTYDKIENVREAVSDSNEQQTGEQNKDINRDVARAVKKDVGTGFNTDAKANELIGLVRNILTAITGVSSTNTNEPPDEASNKQQSSEIETTDTKKFERPDYSLEMKAVYAEIEEAFEPIKSVLASVPTLNSNKESKETSNPSGGGPNKSTTDVSENNSERQVEKSKIYASPFNQGVFKNFETIIERLIGTSKRYEKILSANADEQDEMAAERIEQYGLNNGRNPNDTGDKAGMRRILELYRTNKSSIEQNPELIQNIQLTPGRDVDTTELLKELNKALSGDKMAKAQNGGGFWKNALGFATGGLGYAFMPSLEKSRAQADGLNQMLGNISNALQSVLINIQTKETELSGLQKKGDIKFDDKGNVLHGTSAAKKTLADLEEEKLVLDTIKADLLANDEIIKKTGGRFSQLVKYLNFTSPVLKDNNGILRNINSGLDKNGKALKFQTRLAEVLNYTYQLMSRHIGQMFKNWIMQLNPITQIKKAFEQFTGWNTKWQRTMNVITYNLHAILEPFMDKIAQFLVNCIGFLDIISMKVQEAFGYMPISLFDQAAAESQKIREELEAAANVTAGFDELHDIGSDNSGANDLMDNIYKPQLSQEWIDLAERIGDLFAGIIKGDLGFGEVMKEILGIAWQGIKTLWNKILWPFINNIIWPAIKDNVLEILAWILGAFIAWKGLKLIGKLLLNAISGVFTKTAGTNLLKNLFTDANGIVGIGRNLGTLIAGGILAVVGTMALADAINDSWNQGKSDANTGKEMNLTDKQTGMDALQGALGGAGAVLGGGMIATALGASVALGPLVAVAAGVAALAAVVVVGAEAWAYHSQQNKIANNEMLAAEDYAEQAAAAEQELIEIKDLVSNATKLQSDQQSKLNQLEDEYGMSLDWVNQKVEAAGGSTEMLTDKELALYEQGKKTQESIDNYNRLLEIQLELQNKALWAKEQEAIALNMEAGEYELAALRIEQAELQGVISTEEATAKRIQLYKETGEAERDNLLQNLTPEQRRLMVEYTDGTDAELGKLAKIWDESSEHTRNALLEGVGPETQEEFKRRMQHITDTVEEHQGFWQGVGDTLKEIFTFGQSTTWTYNGREKYYKEGYDNEYYDAIRVTAFDVGTNYVPNDGLAYLHQGEAVIPKKYNQPYQPGTLSPEERMYMNQMMNTMRSLDNTMKQGINVNGQFVQRGSDLVAVVNKTKSQSGADLLSNVSYAR